MGPGRIVDWGLGLPEQSTLPLLVYLQKKNSREQASLFHLVGRWRSPKKFLYLWRQYYYAFRGIRYAKAPTDELRFMVTFWILSF